MSLRDVRILVTGADGFIGSHLTELLARQGARLRVLSLYNSFNSWGWLEDIENINGVEVVNGDIRDSAFVRKITEDIDIVFHLAALIAIPYSYVAPDSYVQTNIIGTLNILQSSMLNKVKKIIHTSTSEVYGTAMSVPISESHPLQAQSPYSATKIGADALVTSFYNSFGAPVVIARPFNTYGPRQSARAVIPTVITQILSGKKEIYLGSLSPTRDFNYVEDTCAGFIALALSDKSVGEIINMGSGVEVSIGKTVELIQEIIGSKIEVRIQDQRLRPEKSEVERLVCDSSKMRRLTGHTATFDLRQGLIKTIEWFKIEKNLSKYKAGIYNV